MMTRLPAFRGYATPRWLTWRTTALLLVALAAVLTTGVVMAQSSFSYDLACRSQYTAAGGVAVSGAFGLNAAAGLPAVGTTQGATYGLRSGYLPGYPVAAAAEVATATVAPQVDEAATTLWLPHLRNFIPKFRVGC